MQLIVTMCTGRKMAIQGYLQASKAIMAKLRTHTKGKES